MCHHPLTVSGPKPAFKWSKHRRPPKSGEQNDPDDHSVRVWRGGTLRTLTLPHTLDCCPKLDTPSVRYLTQHSSIFDLCCADDTLFGVSLSLSNWDRVVDLGVLQILKFKNPDATAMKREAEEDRR